MAAVGMAASWRVRDPLEWAPGDVRDFLTTILPNHPSVDLFTYTSGFVLCSMDKEDLRRQAKDEEATNVIWAELKGYMKAQTAHGLRDRHFEPSSVEAPAVITVYIRMRGDHHWEFEMLPSATVAELKARAMEATGVDTNCQRLICNGMNMQDARSITSYGVNHGTKILLVPQLRDQSQGKTPTFAPRGLLMATQSKKWSAAPPERPYLPLMFSDVSRPFPVSMEFDSSADCQAFAAAAHEEAPMLVLPPPPGSHGQPTQTRIHLEPDAQGVRLDKMGHYLQPSMRYEAWVHFGGRGGEVPVSIVTGNAVS